ncbi:MAG: hypothetical protein E6Q50_07710 [Lysobacter sp.]|nr:MAG: hypothetical protein E6Q50_07710 [Lysobacter sp.]
MTSTTDHDRARRHACACPCGEARFEIRARPFARLYCHCLICQRIYGAPFADVSVLWPRDLMPASPERVKTARYRKPPALDRSTCLACGRPVHGVLAFGPLRAFAFVPTANLVSVDAPAPVAHIFYHRRVADIDDSLPKYSGYWRSEIATTMMLIRRGIAANPR